MSAVNAPLRRAKPVADDRSGPTFTISDLAREFALTTRAIRFYEDHGILAPLREGSGGLRRGVRAMHLVAGRGVHRREALVDHAALVRRDGRDDVGGLMPRPETFDIEFVGS